MGFSPGGTFTCDNCEIEATSNDAVGSWISVHIIGQLAGAFKYFCSDFCYIQSIQHPTSKDDDIFLLPEMSDEVAQNIKDHLALYPAPDMD